MGVRSSAIGAKGDESQEILEEHFNSFAVIDDFLLRLGDQSSFPRMRRIVVAGHSAGGHTVQRYALVTHLRLPSMATEEDLKDKEALRPGIDVRYVVANPSSYAYLNTKRGGYGWDSENTLGAT